MKKPPIAIHVGYPKCASTTIQHNFFAQQPDVLFVSRKGNAGDARYLEQYEGISRALTRGRKIGAARKAWRSVVAENEHSRAFVFSDERITLPVRHCQFSSILDRPAFAYKLFGPARIILVLRQPLDYLRSLYQQMAVNNYRKDETLPKPFTEWLDHDLGPAADRRGSTSQGLFFGEIAARLATFFGHTNVGVFFLEDLRAGPDDFFRSMAAFLDLPSPRIPDVAFAESRNITSEKELMAEIASKAPHFAEPLFPRDFLVKAGSIVQAQAVLLKKMLGVDAMKRWTQ